MFLKIIKVHPKKKDWAPLFFRENLLLDLWQVPDSVEVRQNLFLDSLSACKGVQGQVPDFVVGAWLKL